MMLRLAMAAIVGWVGMGIPAGAQAPATGAAALPATNLGVLQPAVMGLQQTMDTLRVEKWKASKEVKAATAENIGSIRRDLEGTLPGLVTAADAAPGSLAAMLSLSRNVGALYDVAVRVTVIAESAAPADQANALEKSLSGLENARRMLADRMQQMAAAEEARIDDLRTQLNARAATAAVCPAAVATAPARTSSSSAVKRKKKVAKPAARPAPAVPKPAS
jgi:hypothetical protein